MDIFDIRVKFPAAVLLGALWILLVMLPLMAAGVVSTPPLSLWYLFGGLFLYFLYTGIRAWRRGWKSRFVLRVVVPITLLVLSSAFTGAWLWLSR
jgi:hypothetical protein